MKIIVFHLYNDHSGSPSALHTVLLGLLRKGHDITLVTSRGGVLDSLAAHPRLRFVEVPYRLANNPLLRLARTLRAEGRAFAAALRHGRGRIFYSNTVLSFGGALAGRLMRRPVIYHYHENAYRRGPFYRLCARLMQSLAHLIVCVSDHQRNHLTHTRAAVTIPNGIPPHLARAAAEHLFDPDAAFDRHTVLLAATPRDHKGIPLFVRLAAELPQLSFRLILNETPTRANRYMRRFEPLPPNLQVHHQTAAMQRHYAEASLLVNLSDPDRFVESFGMTVAEAAAFGLPAIVPDVGGIAQTVVHGRTGLRTDVREPDRVRSLIQLLMTDRNVYRRMATDARLHAATMSADKQTDDFERILENFS